MGKHKHNHHKCRGPEGPPGPMGPPGSGVFNYVPPIINKQYKIVDPINIDENNETEVISIDIDIPSDWKSYDIILESSLFVDGVDTNCGVVMSFYRDQQLIGSQMVGYNGTDDEIGFLGYHKEIISNMIGQYLEYYVTVKCIDTLTEQLSSVTAINRYIYIQAIRQK